MVMGHRQRSWVVVLGRRRRWWGVVLGLLCRRQVASSLRCVASVVSRRRLLVGQVNWVVRGAIHRCVMKNTTTNDESIVVRRLVAFRGGAV
jgi:hypothetical protein